MSPYVFILKKFFLAIFKIYSKQLSNAQYNIINYSHQAVHYTSMTFLLDIYKFQSPSLILPMCTPTSGNHQSVFQVCLVLESTYKWDHTVFVCLRLAYFTWHNSIKIHTCCKWQDVFLLYGWVIFVCVTFSLSINSLMDT